MVINAIKALKPSHMTQFLTGQSKEQDLDIVVNNETLFDTVKLEKIQDWFINEELEKLIASYDDTIQFITGDNILTIAGIDYTWWIAPVRNKKYKRLEKLFSGEEGKVANTSEKKTRTTRQLQVGIATKNDKEITNIETFNGSIRDCINFINKNYAKRELKSRFADNTVIYIYSGDETIDFTNIDSSEWKTFEQLQEEGVIVTEWNFLTQN